MNIDKTSISLCAPKPFSVAYRDERTVKMMSCVSAAGMNNLRWHFFLSCTVGVAVSCLGQLQFNVESERC